MKVLHICLTGVGMIDNWLYQENLLTKYHAKLGYEVSIITTNLSRDKQGNVFNDERSEYINSDNCKIFRLKLKNGCRYSSKFRKFENILPIILSIRPDIIFVHNIQFLDIFVILKYLRVIEKAGESKPKLFIDSHTDFVNSGNTFLSKYILHKIVWRYVSKKLIKHVDKFYGVLPARTLFLNEIYKIPTSKTETLYMGVDDELVIEAKQNFVREIVRNEIGVSKEEFLIITGGKIDKNKKQVLVLMEAVNKMEKFDGKLVVFGSISSELKNDFASHLSDRIIFVGWLDSTKIYKYFHSVDLAIFPGLHSVYWEQVVGMGVPSIFKFIPGFTHVDLGGNCKFIYNDTLEEISSLVEKVINEEELYLKMKIIAERKGIITFSYKQIALRSLGVKIPLKEI
ncbi:MAG: glycosyltransferase family 4 protein [Tenericutes bacterium]|nr:glycosyltransferase family 4 protein [Mycoplasmatota bacterium]